MEKKTTIPYKIIKGLVKLFYPRISVEGTENLPNEPLIVVANHTQMNGPIANELYFPGKKYIWCAGEMMQLKEVPTYAYQDFWSRKPNLSGGFIKPFPMSLRPFPSACSTTPTPSESTMICGSFPPSGRQ